MVHITKVLYKKDQIKFTATDARRQENVI